MMGATYPTILKFHLRLIAEEVKQSKAIRPRKKNIRTGRKRPRSGNPAQNSCLMCCWLLFRNKEILERLPLAFFSARNIMEPNGRRGLLRWWKKRKWQGRRKFSDWPAQNMSGPASVLQRPLLVAVPCSELIKRKRRCLLGLLLC